MDWIQLISAVGIGALVTKLLDVYWLNRVSERSSHGNWLRDNRLVAYREAAAELLAFGFDRESSDSPFAAYSRLSHAILLCDDDTLARRLDQFVVKRDEMLREESDKEKSTRLYEELVNEAREIVRVLRRSIVRG